MSDDIVITVRGDATVRVQPDQATLYAGVRTTGRDKSAVLAESAAALDAVEVALAGLGGVVATPDTARVPLAWLASSANSYEETRWDPRVEEEQPTGRVIGVVDLEIRVRDLALLDAVGDRLAQHPTVHVHQTEWSVDDDNPAWPRVRADAIRTALHRARDYAAALGGTVARVGQIADAGLLAGGAEQSTRMFGFARASAGATDSASPHLTPQPQVLHAAIDARVVASVPDLSL